MDFLGFRQQAASPDSPEELTRFDVHSLALSAPNKREDEDDGLGMGRFRVRVKSLADRLASGSVSLGMRLRKAARMGASWHAFSRQDLCHDGHLLY